jgi:hypothetical protein
MGNNNQEPITRHLIIIKSQRSNFKNTDQKQKTNPTATIFNSFGAGCKIAQVITLFTFIIKGLEYLRDKYMLNIWILLDLGAAVIYSPQRVLPGDASGDGLINMGDVVQAERMHLGLRQPAPGADANEDGRLSIGDITVTERLILGLKTHIRLTIIGAPLSLVDDGNGTFIPYGSVIYHWSNGITEAFGPDKTRLWMARNSDARIVHSPGGGDVPATFVYGVPNGSLIKPDQEHAVTRVYLDYSLILTVIKSPDACQY